MEDYEDFGPDDDEYGDEYGDADPPIESFGRYSDPSEAHLHPDFARSTGAVE